MKNDFYSMIKMQYNRHNYNRRNWNNNTRHNFNQNDTQRHQRRNFNQNDNQNHQNNWNPRRNFNQHDNQNNNWNNNTRRNFNQNHQNDNQNHTQTQNTQKRRYKDLLFDPPKQIPMNINTIQVRKYCQNLYRNDDYAGLVKLHNCFKLVRRAIMRIKKDTKSEEIDVDIIRSIEAINVTQAEIQNNYIFYREAVMPVDEAVFDSSAWVFFYKEMLPKPGTPIKFTHGVFTVLLDIFSDVVLSEISSRSREQLQNEAKITLQKKLKKLSSDGELTDEIENSLIQSSLQKSYEDFKEIKESDVYKYVDDYREYMREHPVDDFSDPKVVAIWKIITFNCLIIPSNSVVLNQLANTLFSIYTIHYNLMDYVTAASLIRMTFFNDHPDYSNDKATEEIWEEWKELYIYFSIILECLRFSMSNETSKDVGMFDINFITIMEKSFKSKYVKWSYGTFAMYSHIGLESKDGKKQIQLAMNTLTESTLEYNSKRMLIYDEKSVINSAIELAIVNENLTYVVFKFINNISRNRSYVVNAIIEHKTNKQVSFWKLFALILLSGNYIQGDINEIIIKEFNEISKDSRKRKLIIGFCKIKLFLPTEFKSVEPVISLLSKKILILEMKPYKLGQLKSALHDVELLENILKEINTSNKEIEINNTSTEEENSCKYENENQEHTKQSYDKEEHDINKSKNNI